MTIEIEQEESVFELYERDAELAALETVIERGGVLLIEAGAGVGKTALLDAACAVARRQKRVVLRARGYDLERDFAFGIVRQLFERRWTDAPVEERTGLLAGPARSIAAFFDRGDSSDGDADTIFTTLHGLYWFTLNLAQPAPILLAIDDAHWADEASLRWIAYIAARVDGPSVALVAALRPDERASRMQALVALRLSARTIRLSLLSRRAVEPIVHATLGPAVEGDVTMLVHRLTGGNPFYVRELVRAVRLSDSSNPLRVLEDIALLGSEALALQLRARLLNLDAAALRLAQALAILGDGCDLQHAAALADVAIDAARFLATELVTVEVLGGDRPPHFLHPIVRHAVTQTLSSAERDAAHRMAARVLYAERASVTRIAGHVQSLLAVGDAWVVERLRAAAREAIDSGAPSIAADLLERALVEPPAPRVRVQVLREAARAQQLAGRDLACTHLQVALAMTSGRRMKAHVAAELAQAYASRFRWADAVDVLEKALVNASAADALALQCQMLVVGLQDARTAARALRAMRHLSRSRLTGAAATALAFGKGMVAILTGRSATEAAPHLLAALRDASAGGHSWDTRAALLWSLVTAEQFGAVETALAGLRDSAHRSGSSRGLVAVYSTDALLQLKLGDLARADAAARIALRVVRESDFAEGLGFAATVLGEIAIAGGDLDEAQTLLALLPQGDLPASVGSVRIPAARGRLRLAQGRPREALAEFESSIALWHPQIWAMPMCDVGYLHARSGASEALRALGELGRARELADAELVDAQRFGGRRALGVALRTAGLARGSAKGLSQLESSAVILSQSPALLERAHSLIEWGAALRRSGERARAREILRRGLDGAARCGARPLAARAREELRIAGARPRRDWSVGVEALTASELRIVRLARERRTNRQIAQELYLSIKTVEGHLARAYAKLGIPNRKGLDRVLQPEK